MAQRDHRGMTTVRAPVFRLERLNLTVPDRVFADLGGPEPGVPDGMKVDTEGNVYCGGAGGIWIMDPMGKKLGRIVHGAPATTNIAFGGDDWKTLYFTSRNHLGAVNVKIPGIPVPVTKK